MRGLPGEAGGGTALGCADWADPTRGIRSRARAGRRPSWELGEASLGAKNPKLELDLPGPDEDICVGEQTHAI